MRKLQGRRIEVQDGNVEKALRKLKKRITDSGLLIELRERETYTKPTVRKKIAKALAKKRWQKYLRSQQLPPKSY
jgi:small subunit ribosomal protein S21